jgi:hypothetical protein
VTEPRAERVPLTGAMSRVFSYQIAKQTREGELELAGSGDEHAPPRVQVIPRHVARLAKDSSNQHCLSIAARKSVCRIASLRSRASTDNIFGSAAKPRSDDCGNRDEMTARAEWARRPQGSIRTYDGLYAHGLRASFSNRRSNSERLA